ncbi:type I restriction enzyme, S subunit [Enterococcus sp. MSG3327]
MGEVFQQTVEYIDPKEAGLELWSVTVENGLTPKSERYNREFLVKKNDKFKAIHPDEIVYNPMNMTLGSIGFNNSGKDVAVSGYYVTMKLNEGFDTKYFATWLPSPNAINLYKLYATGSLIERQRVQFPTLSGIKTLMPSLNEQKQIGLFFKQLDTTTALHQQKLDQLKRLKQGFLQILFGNKEQAPKVRFAGFDEEWEQRKLGNITESFSGGTPTAGKSEYYGGDIPFIRSGEISSELTELFITENGLNSSSAKMVKVGDILYALYGATSGEVSISRINGAINQAILAIRPTKNDNSYLIVQWLRKQKDTIISTYLQGGQGNLSGSIVKDLVITLPQDREEQNKISTFFKQLDDTINLHQTKLEKLKQLKKAFLQKMFI